MSKVEIMKLGDLENLELIKMGRGNIISKNDILSCPGNFPVYSSSSSNNGEIGRYGKYMFDDERITWSIDGGGKLFYRNNLRYSVTNVCGWLKVLDNKKINTKFLYYLLINQWSKLIFDYSHKAHPSVIRNEYYVPKIDIKVQEEIVNILDSFTNLIDALNEELSLRQKQFEYYREKLLTAKCYISVMKPICELAEDIFSGATPSTKIEKYWTNGDIPWMSSGDIHQKTINDISTFITKKGYDSCSTKMVPIQSIVIALAGQGKTRGTVGITNTALCTNQSLCAIVPNKNEIIPKFLFYYLDKEYDNLRRISSGDGTRGGLNLQMIRNYIIEYPSLDIQQSIVEKLDAFESLISSLKEEICYRW